MMFIYHGYASFSPNTILNRLEVIFLLKKVNVMMNWWLK